MSENYLQNIERHVIDKSQDGWHDRWLELRKQDVTASTIGGLFSAHPYTSALRLYCEKRGVEFERPDDAVLRRGRWLEPAVRLAVAEKFPHWNIRAADCYLRDPDLRLGATPDFFIDGDERGPAILQAKTCAPSVFKREWADGSEPPLWIILQTLCEAMLAKAAFGVVAALTVDPHMMDIYVLEIPRNAAAESKIISAVQGFWRDVESGREPEADFGRDTAVIRALTAKEEPGKTVDLSGDNRLPELLELRAALMRRIKAWEERREEIDNQLKLLLRDAEAGIGLADWRITFRTQARSGYTVPPKNVRVLRITDKRPAEAAAE